MKKDPQILLRHIRESIDLIFVYMDGVSEDGFKRDIGTQDKVLRRIEIIGEAVKGLPDDFIDIHPEVPWRQIASMRDLIIHEYFSIDIDLVWEIVKKKLPELKSKIETMLGHGE